MSNTILATKVHVERKVTFWLSEDEQVVVPARGHNRYVKLDTVVVDLDRRLGPTLFAMGTHVRKDGIISPRWGITTESVDLEREVEATWIERARIEAERHRIARSFGEGSAVQPEPETNEVTGLRTLQFHNGGLFDPSPVDGYAVHLVLSTARGTPGPTLCGIDRFAEDCPGWSVGGGVSRPGITHTACPGCAEQRSAVPELPVTGLGSEAFS